MLLPEQHGGADCGDRVDDQLRRMVMVAEQLLSEGHVRPTRLPLSDGQTAIDDAERLPRSASPVVSGRSVIMNRRRNSAPPRPPRREKAVPAVPPPLPRPARRPRGGPR